MFYHLKLKKDGDGDADALKAAAAAAAAADSADSDEERLPEEKYLEKLSKGIPQGTDKTPEVLSTALHGLSDR